MGSIERSLAASGITLPSVAAPAGLYQPVVSAAGLIFTSGQLPLVNGALLEPVGRGSVDDSRMEDAVLAARAAALNAVAAIRSAVASLDEIDRIVRLTVYVSSAPGFVRQHLVANGASSLLVDVFGEKGIHARSAIGVFSLPLDASVELELVAALKVS